MAAATRASGAGLYYIAPGAYGDLSAILTCLSFATSQAPVSEEAAAGPPLQLAPALALSGAPLGSWGYNPDRLYARWGVIVHLLAHLLARFVPARPATQVQVSPCAARGDEGRWRSLRAAGWH